MRQAIKHGPKGYLTFPYSHTDVMVARGIPSSRKWNPKRKAWEFVPDRHTLQYLRDIWPDIHYDQELENILKGYEPPRAARVPSRYTFKTRPFSHQKEGFELTRDAAEFAIFWEMGLGKSKLIIDTAGHLYMDDKIDALFVLCPNSIKGNWFRELEVHLNVEFTGAYWAAQARKTEREQIEKTLYAPVGLAVLVMNYEALSSSDKAYKVARWFVKNFRVMIAADESSRIKTPGSARTRRARTIASACPYRRILTGTPVTQGPQDLYTQYSFLSPDILGCSSWYSFRNRFVRMGGYENRQIIGYKDIDQLTAETAPFTSHKTKDECLDLPEKVYVRRTVELTATQKKAYKQMEQELKVEFADNEKATAANVLTALCRLQQITSGFLPLEDGSMAMFKHNRINELMNVVDETNLNDGKMIIWARYRQEIRDIVAALEEEGYGPDRVVQFHGGIGTDEREQAIDDFQDPNSRVKIFVGQIQTGGIGLTLTQSYMVVYYSNTFSSEDRRQSEDRAHRIGQTRTVTYVDLVAPGTLDVKIQHALKHKMEVANEVSRGWLTG